VGHVENHHEKYIRRFRELFGAVYKAFATFDGGQSDEQRRFVRDWLLGLRVDDRGWSQFYKELFARFFGKKHFSWECLLRSSLLSSFLIVAIYAVSYVKNRELLVDLASVEASFLVMSLFSAIIADYLSLWKTRLILTKLNPLRNGLIACSIVAVDFVVTTIVFSITNVLALTVYYFIYFNLWGGVQGIGIHDYLIDVAWTAASAFFPLGLLYLAALLTSAWLWIYLIVSYGMRLFPRILAVLSRIQDLENHPVRTIGYAAATVSAAIAIIVTLI
jgi:hypothetical protein